MFQESKGFAFDLDAFFIFMDIIAASFKTLILSLTEGFERFTADHHDCITHVRPAGAERGAEAQGFIK